MDDFMEWACSCRANFDSLVEEHGKIMVFQRELPICLRLVTKAIEICKKRIEAESEQISNGGPVLEVFIPLKPIPFAEDEGTHRHDYKPVVEDDIPNRKPDWLRYAQLWNQDLDPPLTEVLPRKPVAWHARKLGGGAFHPFEKRKQIPVPDQSTPAESSTTETTTATRGEKEAVQSLTRSQSQSRSKVRRSWSEDLHRRFMQALQQLGGSHAATPKQIRELMGVAGLTSDEVKSHLQKYRLHHRRTTPTLHNKWLSPPEYVTAVAAVIAASQPIESTGAPINGIYTPIASQPSEYRSQHQQSSNEERCSNSHSSLADDGEVRSKSQRQKPPLKSEESEKTEIGAQRRPAPFGTFLAQEIFFSKKELIAVVLALDKF